MKPRIDPEIDCVFKALLGSEENRKLLVHFLNAVLVDDLTAPITEAEILNPCNGKEFLVDKLSVVDVKAKDSEGRFYQIEIQLLTYRHLPERMVYTIFFTPRDAWCKENNYVKFYVHSHSKEIFYERNYLCRRRSTGGRLYRKGFRCFHPNPSGYQRRIANLCA